jgi:hypothetical protein
VLQKIAKKNHGFVGLFDEREMTRFFPISRLLLAQRNVCIGWSMSKCYTVVPAGKNENRNAYLLQIAPKIEIPQLARDQRVAVFAGHRAIDAVIFGTGNDLATFDAS